MSTSTNKNGQAETHEEAVETNRVVDTLWNQYEQSLDRARKYRESREEGYLNTIKEVIRFNQEFRGSLANLFQASKETNNEIMKGVSSALFKKAEDKQVIRPELTEQFDELSSRFKQLAATPIAAGLDLIVRLEDKLEESSENYVNFARQRRQGFQKVTDGYVQVARNNHNKLVHRFEESLKVLVDAK
ncbi:hypothetical protein [Neobacillus sp.]|uniref:hypothetical protein n=1 Tax=Neobacillus sp. TaxID=2675273 RepID=UPI00289B29F2|nr:hypothetical protein [Neobacillus sp.]